MLFLDINNIVEGVPAVDLSDGVVTGDYVSLAHYNHCAIVLISGVGTAGNDITLTIQQATSSTGGSVADLDIVTSPVKIWKKQAVTSHASTSVWTDASSGVTDNTWTDAASAEQSLILVVEFDAADLDADGGFEFLRATTDAATGAEPGWLGYILSEPRFARAPDKHISAIA